MLTPRSGRYGIDTNIAIALLRGDEAALGRLRAAEDALLPAPVLGELLYGAQCSGRPAENERRMREFARLFRFVPCDEAVCQAYATIKAALRRQGRPIPNNDMWVAACCVAESATLVSRDRHFDAVTGLPRDEWR